jgi:hypothetical protein
MLPIATDRLRAWLPAAVLAAVACVHLYRVNAEGLSPWKGGGFGMFSTINARSHRVLRVVLRKSTHVGEATFSIDPPQHTEELRRAAEELRSVPTKERLHRYMQLVSQLEYALYRNTKSLTTPSGAEPTPRVLAVGGPGTDSSPEPLPYESLAVELRQIRFHRDPSSLSSSELLSISMPRVSR